jgi:3-oxoacyl-[acyl-carrier-protein] synthase I
MSTLVSIVGIGARTPLGMQAAPSAAAYRAGLSAMGDHPFMIDRAGNPVSSALDSALDAGLAGPDRLWPLAESAMREACAPLADAVRTRPRLPVLLALPEIRPGFGNDDAGEVRRRVAGCRDLPIDVSEVRVLPHGHAAGLAAIAMAAEQMRDGAFDACLVGGVDSYFHPDTVEWLDAHRQLAGAISRSAFVPGEGAAFCLLMTDKAQARAGLTPLARLSAVATAQEARLIKSADICLGAGLTDAVRNAVGRLDPPATAINAVICDINGERYRGEEWAFVCLRLARHFDDPTAYWSPADCWGDMGAASGPLFVMLACQAAARGHAAGPRTMVWASSENGLRAAAILDAAEAN